MERGSPQFSRLMSELSKDSHTDIDEYCLFQSWVVNSALLSHADIISDPKTHILKYEEFLYNKLCIVRALCDWFSVSLSLDRMKAIATAHDFMPEGERPDHHIRQAHPGDYRRKL